jgi:hypothetical protein
LIFFWQGVHDVSQEFTCTITQDEDKAPPSSSGGEEFYKTSNHLQVFEMPEMVKENTMLSPEVSKNQF